MEENNNLKNLSDQLNGVTPVNFQIITKIIQDPDPVKFSNKCTELIKGLNPETIHQYNLTTLPMPTPQGVALIFACVIQYWATDEEFKAWIEELRRNNLFIKP